VEKPDLRLAKSFIESEHFPVALVSTASAKEKQGGGRPDHWEMVFWWTRKPLVSARAVIAASLLPADTNLHEFIKALRLDQKSPHRYNPSLPQDWTRKFNSKTLLDPFAGFGSIPLEAIRLGVRTSASELLPTAFVFLKVILDYPSRYGQDLPRDVERWGKWITNQLRKDALISKLYEDEVAVYVGSWEVKCPHCGKWTTIVGNHWLARLKGKKQGFTKLVWFDLLKGKDGLVVSITDLGKEFKDLSNATLTNQKVIIGDKSFPVPQPNLNSRGERATCLSCGGILRYIDPDTGKHYLEKKNLPPEVLERVQWYVKYAIGQFNSGRDEFARQRLLVKIKMAVDIEFIPCSDADQEKLLLAKKELEALLDTAEVPNEVFAPYGHSEAGQLSVPLWGFDRFYKFFNPRQLLVMTKIAQAIRDVSGRVEEEALAAGKGAAEAFNYSEAVTACFATALVRFGDHNSVVTRLHPSNPMGIEIEHSMAMRGITMGWNWGDTNPLCSVGGLLRTNSWVKCLEKEVEGLNYLVSATGPASSLSPEGSTNRVRVMLDDATVLSKLKNEDRFNVIVTDPPYYGDVAYTELSDFYFVWLKRALCSIENDRLVPKFLPECFFKRYGENLIEIRTQWDEFALREVSLNSNRFGHGKSAEGVSHFQSLLDAAFQRMQSVLARDGLIVTYYAHTNPDAWKALLKSGWQVSGLSVSNAFPITTESAQSVVARGKLSLDTSIVVVWRGLSSGSIQASKLYDDMIEASWKRTESAIGMKVFGSDLFVGALVAALAEATKYKQIVEMKSLDTSELMDRYVYRSALHGLVKAISHKASVEEGVRSGEAMLYLVIKFLYSGSVKKVVTGDDARIFSLGTGVELPVAMNNLKLFRAGSEEEEGQGSSLAKRKMLVLLEPQSTDTAKLKDMLYFRGLDAENPVVRSSIDALHLLEYHAVTKSREQFSQIMSALKTKYPSETDEAIGLAKVISGSLIDDAERLLSAQVVEKSGGMKVDLRSYLGTS
jgi:putative DNA methylase